MQAARILTGAAMALWLGIGLVAPLRPYVRTIRAVILGIYLAGCAAFVGFAVLG